VVDLDDNPARVVSTTAAVALVAFESGPHLAVPFGAFTRDGGRWRLGFSFEGYTVPVMEEQLQVGTRQIEKGTGIRVEKHVVTRHQRVEPEVFRDRLEVERVPRDTWVEPGALPTTRVEGETLILPLLEEVVVVSKRLRLREEVRITRRRVRAGAPEDVALRREEVTVTPLDEGKK
jgi:uncharacterized protein (TIGR02271 family)